ncbi:MAG: hypothetical protein HY690_02300 [Chloroflexi bacterium]|nr:hypothetical protein [Chloroflexota bacterium]
MDETGCFSAARIHRDSALTPMLLEALAQGEATETLHARVGVAWQEAVAQAAKDGGDHRRMADLLLVLLALDEDVAGLLKVLSGDPGCRDWIDRILDHLAADAQQLQGPGQRSLAPSTALLVALAPLLDEPTRRTAFARALDATVRISNPSAQADAVVALAPLLGSYPDLLGRALSLAWAVTGLSVLVEKLADLLARSGLPSAPEGLWPLLASPDRYSRVQDRLFAQGVADGLRLTKAAAFSLDALLRDGSTETVLALLPIMRSPNDGLDAVLMRWLDHPDPAIARHAALLLAEAGNLVRPMLSGLVAMLSTDEDSGRQRAALALHARSDSSRFRVTGIGGETVTLLASLCYQHRKDPRVGTLLSWALREIVHDDPSALGTWIGALASGGAGSAEAREILSWIHQLSSAAWRPFGDALRAGPPAVQEALLSSMSWLLRLGTLPSEALEETRATLQALARSPASPVQREALEALGHLPAPTPEGCNAVREALDGREQAVQAALVALARLAARSAETVRSQVEADLRAALSQRHGPSLVAAAGALVRFWLASEPHSRDSYDLSALLDRLMAAVQAAEPGSAGASLALDALLAAGTDDDGWDAYHERVVLAARTLVERQPACLPGLLERLADALADQDWPRRRITLAIAAAVAERMPAAFAHNADPRSLESLLIRATNDAESFNVRRFGLAILSHLRQVTPGVVSALRLALRDARPVQQDALAAAVRFRRVEDDVLPALAEGLYDGSAAAAYGIAQLLSALGRAPRTSAEQRRATVDMLAAAVRDPRSRRPVYVMEGDAIKYLGPLDHALYQALLQVLGAASAPARGDQAPSSPFAASPTSRVPVAGI